MGVCPVKISCSSLVEAHFLGLRYRPSFLDKAWKHLAYTYGFNQLVGSLPVWLAAKRRSNIPDNSEQAEPFQSALH